MSGTHGIGHTRMATESAVTTEGAHPYTTGPDQCLVHNGSLSNHNGLRRRLVREGFAFGTENDTEVAAACLSWRMREGDTLEGALNAGLSDLDGFYTFVVGTRTGSAVLRDPVCCKPAVVAETDDWVAFGSEYRALVEAVGVHLTQVQRYEAGTGQPTLDVVRRLAIALSVSADMLVFDPRERGPQDDDLKLIFEAVEQFTPDEKATARTVLQGLVLQHHSRK